MINKVNKLRMKIIDRKIKKLSSKLEEFKIKKHKIKNLIDIESIRGTK